MRFSNGVLNGPDKSEERNSYKIRPNFLNLDTIDILDLNIHCSGGLSYALQDV